MELEGIDEGAARQRQRRQDRAHATYTRHFYGVDIGDPSLYHVTLDSTVIALDVCVEMLESAALSITVEAPADDGADRALGG